MLGLPPTSTLFPYTTLFRSARAGGPAPSSVHHVRLTSRRHRIRRSRACLDRARGSRRQRRRSEEHTSELQSPYDLVCRLLLEKKKDGPNPPVPRISVHIR